MHNFYRNAECVVQACANESRIRCLHTTWVQLTNTAQLDEARPRAECLTIEVDASITLGIELTGIQISEPGIVNVTRTKWWKIELAPSAYSCIEIELHRVRVGNIITRPHDAVRTCKVRRKLRHAGFNQSATTLLNTDINVGNIDIIVAITDPLDQKALITITELQPWCVFVICAKRVPKLGHGVKDFKKGVRLPVRGVRDVSCSSSFLSEGDTCQ